MDSVLFDLGGVLVNWNPRHLYRKLFANEAAVERFLAEVMTSTWVVAMDAGEPMAQAVARLVAAHPAFATEIRAYLDRWPEMYDGALDGTVALLARLRERGVPLWGLTNWSHETFPVMRPHYPFLDWFRGIVVSGEERLVKPDPAIFRLTAERFALAPPRTLYIDDSARNAAAAADFGFRAHHFRSAPLLAAELEALGLV
ncbi:MAG: HAD family phosphatase [Alphaproteobacteria bacterium]|nr:HAD family phosphatase [Alphaproteobacteria bacterium]